MVIIGQNALLAWSLRKNKLKPNDVDVAKCRYREVFMASETELFYLVLLILLTFIIHLILSRGDHRRNGQSRR